MVQYISEKGEVAIRNFKYKGGSVAYSYEYLWSPLADKIINFVPRTIAPNLITVIGTIIHIIGNMSLILQEQGKYVNRESLLFFGVCVFVYYTIDNLDGKQARRTKSSTPLGMCMDHGCDVLGVSFISLGVARMALIDDNITLLFTAQIGVLGTFWLSVWAQYHSQGVLLLGKVNAVDDGIPAVAFMGIASYIFGQQIWDTDLGIITAKYILVIFIWVAGVGKIEIILGQIIGFIFNGDNFTKDLKSALKHLIHFPLLSLSLLSVVIFTNWENDHFYAVYFTTMLIIIRDTSYMHVCVTAEETYDQWQFPTIVYIVGYPSTSYPNLVLAIGCWVAGINQFGQDIAVYGMLLFAVWAFLDYSVKCSRQMARILGIEIFRLKRTEEIKNN